MSELWVDKGQEKDALALLSAICDRFNEGVEIADLSKAQRLLGGLGSLA